MHTLLLVDGSSFFYRAHYALQRPGQPRLTNAEGLPTGAMLGVLNMLRRLLNLYPTTRGAWVFDHGGPTFRHALYPAYKATREAMSDDLRAQIAPLSAILTAQGWPILQMPEVEADDVIASLAQQAYAVEPDCQIIIATSDKDMAQLVNERISLYDSRAEVVLDVAGVHEKYHVWPTQIVDYLSLLGDNSDNIPGIPKCGEKTAQKWLAKYGSIEQLQQHQQEISGVIGENLRQNIDVLARNQALIRVRTDLAVPLPHELLFTTPDTTRLREYYQRWGFKRWLAELPVTEPTPVTAHPPLIPDSPQPLAQTILKASDWATWLAKLQQHHTWAFDCETTGLDILSAQIVGLAFALPNGEAAYIPLAHDYPAVPQQLVRESVLAALKPLFESEAYAKVGQNLHFDQHMLANHGISLRGIGDDTLLQSYVLASHERHALDVLAQRYLGHTMTDYQALTGRGKKEIPFSAVEIEAASAYAVDDARIAWRLAQHFNAQLRPQAALIQLYRELELPLIEVLCAMERTGVLLDCQQLQQQSHALGQRLLALEAQAYALAGQPFNLNSPKQLQTILFEKLGLPTRGIRKTASGGYSTDEEVLQQLALDFPLPKCLLEYRRLAKLKSTYTDKLPQMRHPLSGRIHTHYAQAVAVTGRLASSEPNLQNIPIRTPEGQAIRQAFIAPAGHVLLAADYAQIELRIMAHLSGDAGLLAAFAAGEDIHRTTAAEIFAISSEDVTNEQRRYAKTINFGLIYGMSSFGLAKELGITRVMAQQFIDRYFARYPGVADYMAQVRAQAASEGYVSTVLGRRLWLPELHSAQAMRRQAAERAAINAPMQGTAADIIKRAMLAVFHWLRTERLHSRLILQVHDELILEVPTAELAQVQAALPTLMENVLPLAVPLVVNIGVGAHWQAAHA